MSKRELTSKSFAQAKAKPSETKPKPSETKAKPSETKPKPSETKPKLSGTKAKASSAKPKLALVKAKPAAAKVPAAAKSLDRAAKSKKDPVKQEKPQETGVTLPPGYHPRDTEPFMNHRQRAYFRQKLKAWRTEILEQTRETLAGLHEDSSQHADIADRATSETDKALELRARDRQRKLVAKIDSAIARLDDGSYGYCAESGEPIGLRRLEARPIATLSLEAQERHERREKVYRDE